MFPWNNLPNGEDKVLGWVAKIFMGLLVISGIGLGLFQLWVFLDQKLDNAKDSPTATAALDDMLSSAWGFILLWWPLLMFILIIGVCISVGSRYVMKSKYRQRATKGVKYLQILPSKDVRLELEKISELTRTFGRMARPWQLRWKYGIPWFRLRFAIPPDRNEIGIYLAYPQDKENSVKDTLRSVYASAEIHDLNADQFPSPTTGGTGGHFLFHFGRRKGLPLASLHQQKQSQLGSILNCLRPGTYLDLHFAPVRWKDLEDRTDDAYDSLKSKKMKDMDPEEKARRVSLTQRMTGRELTFTVRLSLWSNHEKADSVVRSTAESIETAVNYDGAIWFLRQKYWNPLADQNLVPLPWPFTTMTWTSDEISTLFHIPPGDHYIYTEPKESSDARGYVLHLQENQRSIAADELNEGVLIGNIHHPMGKREVRVNHEQLAKHYILTGASGMGKSSLSVEMIQSILDDWLADPDQHPGFTIIDPARELVPIIENRLRIAEKMGVSLPKDKIHHFNLAQDTKYVPALNLLHKVEGMTSNMLAQQTAKVLVTELSSNEESLLRSRRLMGVAIQSLLEDEEPHTILGIDDLFRNLDFRNKVLKKVKDPYVKRFWLNSDEQELKRDAEPVLHRIDRLLQKPKMRRILCQKNMTLDIQKYMDEGHLVFIDTYGMKDYDLRVTVGHLINQYHQVSKRREAGARFHHLLIDEAQMLELPLLTEILSEDRKYAYGIGMITREIDQLKNQDLLQAIRTNIGMIISCGQTEGSDEVEALTRGYLKAPFLERLPERHAALYMRGKRNQRSEVKTCVVQNEPPDVYKADGTKADYRTHEKDQLMLWGLSWGEEMMETATEVRPIADVDEEIKDYMSKTLLSPRQSTDTAEGS
ncbi:hypothetical protein IC620_00500 [Hazenella sp. IB182357]|uniref:Uncharacterized protein n=1 Tax=Polycladospora coralii TaxID=2771432 RepID=A0A926N8P7_9BACL|nr:hypothetical protein [Polycladospora coralii]MBD1370840.1 hypothetical protein [Polycladospora coralii]MBS7529779.1 hypothetical protein [Polycladospora coralii]